jgi:hypothetical protein
LKGGAKPAADADADFESLDAFFFDRLPYKIKIEPETAESRHQHRPSSGAKLSRPCGRTRGSEHNAAAAGTE